MKVVKIKTLYEAWTRKKPNIAHLSFLVVKPMPSLFLRKERSWKRYLKSASLWAMKVNIEAIGSTLLPSKKYYSQGI